MLVTLRGLRVKRHSIKQSPCIKWSVVKVPNLFPLNQCLIFTCTKRSWSHLSESH